ncbi:MAG: CRISPR-associated endonuclease Cas2 [Nanoarchaeota archaeon]
MRVILIYDVNVKRVTKIMKICREYLEHIQNSVFEGDLTDANLKELKMRLKEVINPEEDSVIIFRLWNSNYKKEIIGIEKNSMDNII